MNRRISSTPNVTHQSTKIFVIALKVRKSQINYSHIINIDKCVQNCNVSNVTFDREEFKQRASPVFQIGIVITDGGPMYFAKHRKCVHRTMYSTNANGICITSTCRMIVSYTTKAPITEITIYPYWSISWFFVVHLD